MCWVNSLNKTSCSLENMSAVIKVITNLDIISEFKKGHQTLNFLLSGEFWLTNSWWNVFIYLFISYEVGLFWETHRPCQTWFDKLNNKNIRIGIRDLLTLHMRDKTFNVTKISLLKLRRSTHIKTCLKSRFSGLLWVNI